MHSTLSYAYDPHWTPAYAICHPCRFRYDFILKTESFTGDTNQLLEKLGLEDRAENQLKHANPKDEVTSMKNTYERHKKLLENVTAETVRKFIDKYYFDFLMFDYDIEEMEKIADEKEKFESQ